jgi:hypothetical protein
MTTNAMCPGVCCRPLREHCRWMWVASHLWQLGFLGHAGVYPRRLSKAEKLDALLNKMR